MSKKVIVVLFGGQSPQHEVSKISAAAAINVMDTDKYYVMPVYITHDGKWMMYDGPVENIANRQWEKYATRVILSPDAQHKGLLRIVGDRIKNISVDLVFPLLHGGVGGDGAATGLLEMARLPYIGSGMFASNAAGNKMYMKKLAKRLKIKTADYIVFSDIDKNKLDSICGKVEKTFGYPVVVKPSRGGSSIGVNKVENKEELKKALVEADMCDSDIIVERAIKCREFECGILGKSDVIVSQIGEIKTEDAIYSFDAKYNSNKTEIIVPADIEDEKMNKMHDIAVKIFRELGCKGPARADFLINEETGDILFNGLNTMPQFNSNRSYIMLWEASGIEFDKLIEEIIDMELESTGE